MLTIELIDKFTLETANDLITNNFYDFTEKQEIMKIIKSKLQENNKIGSHDLMYHVITTHKNGQYNAHCLDMIMIYRNLNKKINNCIRPNHQDELISMSDDTMNELINNFSIKLISNKIYYAYYFDTMNNYLMRNIKILYQNVTEFSDLPNVNILLNEIMGMTKDNIDMNCNDKCEELFCDLHEEIIELLCSKYTRSFTDASYNQNTKIAVIGYIINNSDIIVDLVNNTTSSRAEILGLINVVKKLDMNKKNIVYTDCMTVIKRIGSKDKLIKSDFKSKKGILLNNGDLYKELFGLLNDNIIIKHIRGHVPTKDMNKNNEIFSKLDKYVRKLLREVSK